VRTWLLAIAALTLVALTSPITAGDKRASALAVRVTVVRSCSVSTESGGVIGGMVTCGSRFGPPVMSASSTITVPMSGPPAARIDAGSTAAAPVQREGSAAGGPAAERDAVERVTETVAESSPALVIPRSPGAASVGNASSDLAEIVAFRLVTVNF
jgi:hypothetical protein